MASPITLDGQLTDWTRVDRLDFNTTSVNGFAVYGHTVDGLYHFAIASDQVPIGAGTTMWLNSDQNAATGYQIFNQYLGAEYKIEFVDESASGFGVRPQLYSVAQDGTSTLVEGGVTFAFSPSGQVVEFAIDKTKIGNSAAVKAVLDVNDTHFLPSSYSQGEYTLKEEPLPVRTDPALKVGIVFSETSAKQYFSETAYSQLFMAVQNQAAAAGIPFDILTESDLTDLSTVVNYDALIFPSFGFVPQDKLNPIEDVLTAAVYKYGISLVAAGNFMTNDETGLPLPGDAYARMKALLGVERVGGNAVANVTVTATGDASAAVIGYGEGEVIRSYSETSTSKVGTAYFGGASGVMAQVLATQTTAEDGTHNAILATQTGSNNVFFATEGMLADSNMLQHAIGWAAHPDGPSLKLQMSRHASLFAARNDMDQSQNVADVSAGIYDKLLPILQQWKTDFNFVGSYYVNIGNDPSGGQTTDWSRSKPFYDQLLAMGNEIGTHTYTHPDNTNLLTPEQIEFEFNQSKLLLEQVLGVPVAGAAIPGNPENLQTSQLISPYFSYISGGYAGVGAGYPGAFGYLTPGSDSIYLAPNMKFDFSLVEAAPEFGGGMTAEQAKQEWIREYNELSLKSDLPVFVWPWHDYGPTQWTVADGQTSPYTTEMYTDLLRYAYQQGAEFVTMLDLAERIKAFEKAGFNYSFDSVSGTITATVTANQVGTFALDLEEGNTIASVSGWYAYDNDSVFLDADGGTYTIKLGTAPEDVTHITALPARAQLLAVSGDGTNLTFSMRGEGTIAIDLTDPKGRSVKVTGAEIASQNGDKLELKVSGTGEHAVSVKLQPPALNVALAQDSGISGSDKITNNGLLSVTGAMSIATIEYSLDANTWTTSFTPVEGSNTVYLRQKDTVGTVSDVTAFSFVLDRVGPTASIELPPLGQDGTSAVTITFSEPPANFDPAADLEVIGGTLTSLTPDGTGRIYTGTFKPFDSYAGVAMVGLKGGSYTDSAGNPGSGISATLGVDTRAPAVASIFFSDTFLKTGETADVTIVFSEKVTGFNNTNVTVENGTLSNLVSSDDGTTWHAAFTPNHDIEDLTNVLQVTGTYTDLAGNVGTGSASDNYAIDTKGPTAAIEFPSLGRNGTSAVTITFSDPPANFDPAADLEVIGGTLTSLTPDGTGRIYTGTFKPFGSYDGGASITLKGGSYTDSAGNPGLGVSITLGVDTMAPVVSSVRFSDTSLRVGETAEVAIVFSERVTDFDSSDVAVENGTLSNLVSSDGGATWSAVFTPTANIEELANVLKVAGHYTDIAGNVGSGSASDNYAIDTKNPTVDISQTKVGTGRTVAATFTFSEAIGASSFTAQDIAVTGAKLHGLVSNGGASYSAILTPHFSSNGKVSVAVKDASYADVSGNTGVGAAETFAITSTKGTGSADWIVGTNGKNALRGGNGDDVIRGGKGNDTIMGDGGRDLLDLSDGRKGVTITLSQHDTRYGTFDGRSAGLGIDKYRDMEGVIGTRFSDKLIGSAGSDILAGLGGSDVLRGGRGNDVFVFESKGGRDRIMDFEDTGKRHDKLDVSFCDFDVSSANFAVWKVSHVNQVGHDTVITLDSDTSIRLADIKAKAIGFDDFLF